MKKILGILIIAILIPISLLIRCNEVLDKNNLGVYGGDLVWTSESQTSAYLNNIYSSLMPGWTYNGSASDEGTNGDAGMSSYLKGIATIDSWDALSYSVIDRINLFLSKIDATPYSADHIKQYKGQALFWRAWSYFGMVQGYGGVPLILQVQDSKNPEGLFVKRNKTSECFTQMVKDLDDAISMLPDTWSGTDYGRIDKGAAMAFKGKVLMWWASPLFNPANDVSRWQTAYTANKTAVDFLTSQGKGLLPAYKDIWYTERNKEVVMVNQFFAPDHYFNTAGIRPMFITQGDWGRQPALAMVNAFPMKDGAAFDPARSLAYDTLFKYRDDRFYATLAYNGSVYPTPDFKPGEKIWTGFNPDGKSLLVAVHNEQGQAGRTGFWQIKSLDKTTAMADIAKATVDWIEIRFAEVLMNYGECANESGKTSEAQQVLYDIRKRAGIWPGNGAKYGITASSVSDIRTAFINERFVEFAYENKRWNDLRRWRRFDILNSQVTRKTVQMWVKPGTTPFAKANITDNIEDQAVWSRFTPKLINNIEDASAIFNLTDKLYFYGIPKRHLDANPNIEQNKDWGGTFDPLQ